jgi:GTP-binding protein
LFLDETIIEVRSGHGGKGCSSFRREKFVPKGGPDGGDGGRGGHIWVRATRQKSTLLDVGRKRIWVAENGRPGRGALKHGRQGRDLTIEVPVGTVVREIVAGIEPREGHLLADLVGAGMRVLVAQGGLGGRGNKSFASATRQVPTYSQDGIPGESKRLYFELKLLADVGLVGLPNAGKSTLLSRVSAATPKIADYPFTTLRPNLGIVELGDFTRLVFADIPGLIEGAHDGHGLGTEFLRHIERTGVIIHLVSCEPGDVEACWRNFTLIENELRLYSGVLAEKPRIVALSKTDLFPADVVEDLRSGLEARLGARVIAFSAATGQRLGDLIAASARLVGEHRVDEAASVE